MNQGSRVFRMACRGCVSLLLVMMLSTTFAFAQRPRAVIEPSLVPGSLVVDRVARQFYYFRPEGKAKGALPMVMALHGGGAAGDALRLSRSTGFNAMAAREGFMVVYPNGLGNSWNDGRRGRYVSERLSALANDVQFLGDLMKLLVARGLADPARLFVAGVSNGGMMALRLGCEMASRLAAVASVIAAFPTEVGADCKPNAPLPVLMINGTADPLIPWDGGAVASPLGRNRGSTWSVPKTISFWRRHNGCSGAAVRTELPKHDPSDKTRVIREVYSKCRGGSEVWLFRIEGGGHAMPRRTKRAIPRRLRRLIGTPSRELDGTRTIWEFFRRHSRKR